MFNRIAPQAAALALAAFVTVSALAGMGTLADQSYRAASAAAEPVQMVVIVGQRHAKV